MTVPIRPLTPADVDAVVALSLRAWAPVFASMREVLGASGVFDLHYPDGWEAAQREAVGAACADPDLLVWVADPGEVAGFVAVRLHEADRMGEIHMIAVDPAHQRRGIGAALTSWALEQMRAAGMTSSMVETGGDPGHAPARALYAASGLTLMPVARYFGTL